MKNNKNIRLKLDHKQAAILNELLSYDINKILYLISSEKNHSMQFLLELYLKPYMLYDSNFITEDNMEDFVNFVISRYTTEINELNLQLEFKLINKKEYKSIKDDMDEKFFANNPVGINIGRIMEKNNEKVLKLSNNDIKWYN